jgi:hypothetical protein
MVEERSTASDLERGWEKSLLAPGIVGKPVFYKDHVFSISDPGFQPIAFGEV